ncbi:MAG: flagellar hook-associated protein FlgK [Balneolia bacterium]|nr:flagellar hook-associated protein FlgK [Balneolia bacterium]
MRTLFEISKSGLRAAERSLSVTSNNIVNADTPGYTRQRIEQSPIGMQKTNFHAGLGVNITDVSRLRNSMNDILMNDKRQDMAFMQEKAKIFEQLEASMATDTGGDLDLRISRFFDAFSSLSADPQDLSVRNNLLSEATQLTAKFGDLDRAIQRTSELTRDSAIQTVNSINLILKDVENLNNSIKLAQAQGNPDLAALDKRVQKLADLSKLVDFESNITDTGAVEIQIGGIKVLDETQASSLKPEINDIGKSFTLRLPNGKAVSPTGGKLGAEIEMYEKAIPDMGNRLDQLASTMVDRINNIHMQGFGLDDATNRNFFNPEGVSASDMRVDEAILGNINHIAASTENGEAGNGELAILMSDLRNQPVLNGRKLVDSAVSLISSPGSTLSNLRSQMDTREAEINMLNFQQEREAGVNIDEELSQMIKYQNAYQGAARIMSSAQQMYDTLIGLVR